VTISQAALQTRLARKVGDPGASTSAGAVWDATDLAQALTEAVEEIGDYFYVPIAPDTTYTGAVSSIAANTAEIAVPSAFLPVTVAGSVSPPGFISAIEIRETGTLTYTEPLYARWQFISQGLMIDPLTVISPKIRFNNPFNSIFEMRIYGGAAITLPASTAAPIPGTDQQGLVPYLMAAASAKLFEMRETSSEEDARGYRTRRLLAEDKANKLKAQFRMIYPELTAFSWT
jgi:hypothetical protein